MTVVSTWDGENRLIYLSQGVTSFHPIEDIYREYRTERRVNEDFRKWNPFMIAVGNVPKGGGKATPRYLVLLEGVKIVPYDEAITIDVTGEVITDDQTDPFDYSSQTTPTVVRYSPADAEIVYVEIRSPLQDSLDYRGEVHLDSVHGIAGTDYPVGTASNPVNNFDDAVTIARAQGCTKILVDGNVTCSTDISRLTIEAETSGSIITMIEGNNCSDTRFVRVFLGGNFAGDGFIHGDYVGLQNVTTGLRGIFTDSIIYGKLFIKDDITLLNCVSGMGPSEDVAHAGIDVSLAGDNVNVLIRGYVGRLDFYNTVMGDTISCDITSGRVTIEPDCLGGDYIIRGFGEPLVVEGTYTTLDVDGYNAGSGGVAEFPNDFVEQIWAGMTNEALTRIWNSMPTGANVTTISPVYLNSDVEVIVGDDYATPEGRELVWVDPNNIWPDLTGSSFTMTIYHKGKIEAVINTIDYDDITSSVIAQMFSSDTVELTPGKSLFDIQATLPGGHIVTLVIGNMRVIRGYSRP